MQEMLVGRFNVHLSCPGERVLQLYIVWPEAVVVQRKDGRNQARPSLTFPQRILVLGRNDAEFARDFYALHVLGLASRAFGVLRRDRVELVVARNPKDVLEAFRDLGKGHATVLGRLPHVSTEYQVIVRMGNELFQRLAVAFEREVNVADAP